METNSQIANLEREIGEIKALLAALPQRISPQSEKGCATGFGMDT